MNLSSSAGLGRGLRVELCLLAIACWMGIAHRQSYLLSLEVLVVPPLIRRAQQSSLVSSSPSGRASRPLVISELGLDVGRYLDVARGRFAVGELECVAVRRHRCHLVVGDTQYNGDHQELIVRAVRKDVRSAGHQG